MVVSTMPYNLNQNNARGTACDWKTKIQSNLMSDEICCLRDQLSCSLALLSFDGLSLKLTDCEFR